MLPPLPRELAVLVSGGLDSAILVGVAREAGAVVHPLYVRNGHIWQTVEETHLRGYLQAIGTPGLRPLQVLEVPVADLYETHWSITGQGVPDERSAEEAVFLPGRNVLLLGKALLWCHLHGVGVVAVGHLKSNPFRDATPQFFTALQKVVNQAVAGEMMILRPFSDLSKSDVMHLGRGLPLESTFSCIRPVAGRHCGRCNKCAERRQAFAAAQMADRTAYDSENPCTA
jgi:7-cyano-7-deazaguanine synthase